MTIPTANSKSVRSLYGRLKMLIGEDALKREPVTLIVLLLIATAESLTVFSDLRLGFVLHVATIIWLLRVSIGNISDGAKRLYLALILLPMIRIISFGMPLAEWSQALQYVAVSVPLFVGMGVVLSLATWSRFQLGLNSGNTAVQTAVGALGIVIGWLAYLILRPASIVDTLSTGEVWLFVLILSICTGLVEELLFRGMLQNALVERLGEHQGVLLGAFLYAVLHIGYASIVYIMFAFVIGLLFGVIVLRTKSILGVTVAHALTNILLLLVFPVLIAG